MLLPDCKKFILSKNGKKNNRTGSYRRCGNFWRFSNLPGGRAGDRNPLDGIRRRGGRGVCQPQIGRRQIRIHLQMHSLCGWGGQRSRPGCSNLLFHLRGKHGHRKSLLGGLRALWSQGERCTQLRENQGGRREVRRDLYRLSRRSGQQRPEGFGLGRGERLGRLRNGSRQGKSKTAGKS